MLRETLAQPIELWLIRHAPLPPGKIYGHTDKPADFSDLGQLSRLAKLLPEAGGFVSSDLMRSSETAERLLEEKSRSREDLTRHAGLREQNFGDWENRSYAEIEAADPTAYHGFWQDPAANCPPGGESFVQLQSRIQAEMDRLLAEAATPDLICVIHAGPIRSLLGTALGLTPAASLAFQIDPLSLTRLTLYRQDGARSWKIGCVNLKA